MRNSRRSGGSGQAVSQTGGRLGPAVEFGPNPTIQIRIVGFPRPRALPGPPGVPHGLPTGAPASWTTPGRRHEPERFFLPRRYGGADNPGRSAAGRSLFSTSDLSQAPEESTRRIA